MIAYTDTIVVKDGYYEVTRIHSDGKKAVARCGFHEIGTQTPDQYLDRLLSQHLSGTGQQRKKVDTINRGNNG